MQTDIHYYGTYATARAPGPAPKVRRTNTTAAEFVGDNRGKETIELPVISQ